MDIHHKFTLTHKEHTHRHLSAPTCTDTCTQSHGHTQMRTHTHKHKHTFAHATQTHATHSPRAYHTHLHTHSHTPSTHRLSGQGNLAQGGPLKPREGYRGSRQPCSINQPPWASNLAPNPVPSESQAQSRPPHQHPKRKPTIRSAPVRRVLCRHWDSSLS